MTSSIGTGSRTATSGTDKGERDPTKLEKKTKAPFSDKKLFPEVEENIFKRPEV